MPSIGVTAKDDKPQLMTDRWLHQKGGKIVDEGHAEEKRIKRRAFYPPYVSGQRKNHVEALNLAVPNEEARGR